MAISPNAKRARNTSESEEKNLSKKKKHSEGAAESFSSPLFKGKKGRLSKAGTPNVGEQKAIKDKASIGSKKGGKETQIKNCRKQKTIAKGSGKVSKGKKEPEDGDEESEEDEGGESEEQESEEGGNEEVQGSEDDSDEEAGENEESDDDAEAEENADSDDGGKEAGGNDSDESDSDDDGGEKKDKKPQFGSRNNEFTLFVTNIPYSAEMDDLKKFFSVAGNVKEVRVPVNNKTGRPRGFAFVCMEDEEAMNAALKLDNEEMEGRPLKVQKSLDGGSGGGGGGRFQRGGGGRWRGDRGGFRGGRGFSRDRRGGGFGGDRGGRGFDRSRSGFSGDRSSSSSSRGFGERSGGRGFGRGGGGGGGSSRGGGFKGDRDRKGGFERSRGSGRPYDRDSSSKNSRQSGGDSD